MLGLDEEKLKQWARQNRKESHAEFRARALANDILSNQVTVKDDNGTDVTDALAQMGRPLTSEAITTKLKKCNAHLRFERAINFPDLMGIYILDPQGRHAINGEKVKHLMGMEAGTMPEFTVIHKTQKKIANPELFGKHAGRDVNWLEVDTYQDRTMGWRSVLVRLLHQGLITRFDVEKHFGWTPSRDSQKWHEQTN